MVDAKFRGINKVKKRLSNGKIAHYYYHRRTGIRMKGVPGSDDFLQSYLEAQKAGPSNAPIRGKFKELINYFLTSPEFERLAEKTKKEYRKAIRVVEEEFGGMPVEVLADPGVRAGFIDFRNRIAKRGTRWADCCVGLLARIIKVAAVERGLIAINHAARIENLYASDRSDKIWLPEQIGSFMGAAPYELRLVMMLALHTGLRQGDLRRLIWSAYDGQSITAIISKTGKKGRKPRSVQIPCTSALREALNQAPRRAAVILTTKTGRRWTEDYLRKEWEKVEETIGVAGELHFHDLRGTAVTMLSEAGCTPQMIATITGHSLKTVVTILESYLARTGNLAREAIRRFENAPETEFANRLQTGAPELAKGAVK